MPILLLAVVACLLVGCGTVRDAENFLSSPPCDDDTCTKETNVVVFVDLTELEESSGVPQAQQHIEQLLDLITPRVEGNQRDPRLFDGGKITFVSIGDQSVLGINPEEEIGLAGRNDNLIQRREAVRKFRDSASTKLRDWLEARVPTSQQTDIYGQSLIVAPICSYLRRHANDFVSGSDHGPAYDEGLTHKLIIFSDMLENSVFYSFYEIDHETDKDEVVRQWRQECQAERIFDVPLDPGKAIKQLDIEYQMIAIPLPPGRIDTGQLQAEAQEVWRTFFNSLGLRETNLVR